MYSLTVSWHLLSVFKSLHQESGGVSGSEGVWEDGLNAIGVGVEDSVETKASSFNWMLVHVFIDLI